MKENYLESILTRAGSCQLNKCAKIVRTVKIINFILIFSFIVFHCLSYILAK